MIIHFGISIKHLHILKITMQNGDYPELLEQHFGRPELYYHLCKKLKRNYPVTREVTREGVQLLISLEAH